MAKAFQILALNKISPTGLKRLPAGRYHVGDKVAHPDAILVRSHNMLEMNISPSVLAIARAGAGTNNVPVQKMSERGVPVFIAPGANANAVKVSSSPACCWRRAMSCLRCALRLD